MEYKLDNQEENIVIGDQTALHALLHGDMGPRVASSRSATNPLHGKVAALRSGMNVNGDNPLYGGPPIVLLVPDDAKKRRLKEYKATVLRDDLPPNSFFRLRKGLYMASPELVYVRMAAYVTEMRLAEIGMNLCARYYVRPMEGDIRTRSRFLATPESLATYLQATSIRGCGKARSALRWVIGNSGSPYETKVKLLFCSPFSHGGLALPFDAMNFDVSARKLVHLTEQSRYSIDLVCRSARVGLEYDGGDYHQDASSDKIRRNELKALDWDVFPIDKHVLFDPGRTARAGELIARRLGIRQRKQAGWESKYVQLRSELGLPI